VFGRKKRNSTAEATPAAPQEEAAAKPTGKGRPTPTRREQEAARKRPLVPDDRRAAKQASREAAREARVKQNQAMQTGDERYLPVRDRGPQRRFIRDSVDSRYNMGDYFLIFLIAVFVLSLFLPPEIQQYSMVFMWAVIILWVLDTFFKWRGTKKRIIERFGAVEPGSAWYMTNRMMMIRRLRLPKPQVSRGEQPS
jgi:hypothetical protein